MTVEQIHFNFFALLSDAIVAFNTYDGKILFANKPAIDLLNFTKEEIYLLNIFDLFPKNAELQIIVKTGLKKEEVVELKDIECIRNDDTPFFTRVGFNKLSENVAIALINYFETKDCYSLKKENLIKDKIINELALPVIVTDINFNIKKVNKEFLKIFGYSEDEISRKKTIKNFFIHNAKYQLFIKDLKKQKRSFRELKGITKEGKVVELYGDGCIISEGKETIASLSFIDVTEFKETQANLNVFKKFVDASGQGFRISSLDGIMIYANKRLLSLLGLRNMEDLYGRSIFEFFPEEIKELYSKEILPKLKAGEMYTKEISLINLKEQKISIIDNFFFIENQDGKPEYLSEVVTDITEIKELQDQLIISEKMRTIGFLAAGIAHEFNNILAIIKSTAQMLLYNIENNKNYIENISEELKAIDLQTDKGAKIVKSLTALVKSKSRKEEFYYLDDVIQELIDVQQNELTKSNISVIKNIKLKEKIKVDKALLQQVLLELFLNSRDAIKAIGKGVIDITVKREGNFLVIIFKDTGIGMTDDVKNNIFNPFFTTKGAFSTKDLGLKGVGLGLSVVLKIIKEMGGYIEIKSKENEGTVFILRVPILN